MEEERSTVRRRSSKSLESRVILRVIRIPPTLIPLDIIPNMHFSHYRRINISHCTKRARRGMIRTQHRPRRQVLPTTLRLHSILHLPTQPTLPTIPHRSFNPPQLTPIFPILHRQISNK